MTVADKTDPSQTNAITFEFELRHPPEKIWRALTDPVLLNEWLLPVVDMKMMLERGSTFRFKTQPHPGWDGTVDCEIIASDPPHHLSYAWRVPFLNTVVSFTLTPTVTGTTLSLVQSGFLPEQKQNFGGARYGWKMMGEKLIQLLSVSVDARLEEVNQ